MAFKEGYGCKTPKTCALHKLCADAHYAGPHVNEAEARTDEMDLQLLGLDCNHPQMQEVRRRAEALKNQIADQD